MSGRTDLAPWSRPEGMIEGRGLGSGFGEANLDRTSWSVVQMKRKEWKGSKVSSSSSSPSSKLHIENICPCRTEASTRLILNIWKRGGHPDEGEMTKRRAFWMWCDFEKEQERRETAHEKAPFLRRAAMRFYDRVVFDRFSIGSCDICEAANSRPEMFDVIWRRTSKWSDQLWKLPVDYYVVPGSEALLNFDPEHLNLNFQPTAQRMNANLIKFSSTVLV